MLGAFSAAGVFTYPLSAIRYHFHGNHSEFEIRYSQLPLRGMCSEGAQHGITAGAGDIRNPRIGGLAAMRRSRTRLYP